MEANLFKLTVENVMLILSGAVLLTTNIIALIKMTQYRQEVNGTLKKFMDLIEDRGFRAGKESAEAEQLRRNNLKKDK